MCVDTTPYTEHDQDMSFCSTVSNGSWYSQAGDFDSASCLSSANTSPATTPSRGDRHVKYEINQPTPMVNFMNNIFQAPLNFSSGYYPTPQNVPELSYSAPSSCPSSAHKTFINPFDMQIDLGDYNIHQPTPIPFSNFNLQIDYTRPQVDFSHAFEDLDQEQTLDHFYDQVPSPIKHQQRSQQKQSSRKDIRGRASGRKGVVSENFGRVSITKEERSLNRCTRAGCSRIFKKKEHMLRHINTTHDKHPTPCLLCPEKDRKMFDSGRQDNLKAHYKLHAKLPHERSKASRVPYDPRAAPLLEELNNSKRGQKNVSLPKRSVKPFKDERSYDSPERSSVPIKNERSFDIHSAISFKDECSYDGALQSAISFKDEYSFDGTPVKPIMYDGRYTI